jgi:Flp pilus assembly pilin Flp
MTRLFSRSFRAESSKNERTFWVIPGAGVQPGRSEGGNIMSWLRFLQEKEGSIAVEYMLFVAAAAILLTVGLIALMGGMSSYFNSWAAFFNSGS